MVTGRVLMSEGEGRSSGVVCPEEKLIPAVCLLIIFNHSRIFGGGEVPRTVKAFKLLGKCLESQRYL